MSMKNIALLLLSFTSIFGYSQGAFPFLPTDTTSNITLISDIPGNVLWLESDYGVVDSVGGSIANDEGVGAWTSRDPNGFVAVDGPTTAQRPIYKSSGGKNNGPYIAFVNDSLGLPYNTAFEKDYVSVFMVIWSNASGTNQGIYQYSSAAATLNTGYRIDIPTTSTSIRASTYHGTVTTGNVSSASGRWLSYSMFQNPQVLYAWDDSELLTGMDFKDTPEIIWTTNPAHHKIGARSTANYGNFHLMALIVFATDSPMSLQDISMVRKYLNTKYDIHTYTGLDTYITSPLAVDSLEGWWISDLAQDSVGNTLTSDGSRIYRIPDLSIHNRDFIQTDWSKRPLLKTFDYSWQRNTALFDGTDDWMVTNDSIPWYGDDLTLVIVHRYTTPIMTNTTGGTNVEEAVVSLMKLGYYAWHYRGAASTASPAKRLELILHNTGDFTNYRTNYTTANSKNSTPRMLIITHNGSTGTTMQFEKLVLAETGANTGTGNGTIYKSNRCKFGLGARNVQDTPLDFFSGDVQEMMIFSKVLTTPEIDNLLKYAVNKYRIYYSNP